MSFVESLWLASFVSLLAGLASSIARPVAPPRLLPRFVPALIERSLVRQLDGKPHERYDGRHVYVVLKGSRYHVERFILERYMPIDDDDIKPLQGPPLNPKKFRRMWWIRTLSKS